MTKEKQLYVSPETETETETLVIRFEGSLLADSMNTSPGLPPLTNDYDDWN